MAPIAIHEIEQNINNVDLADLKAKAQAKVIELQAPSHKPAVADDFMYDFKYNHALPTTDVLGIDIPEDCDAQKEAGLIVDRLSQTMSSGDANAFTDLFLDYGELAMQSDSWSGTDESRFMARQAGVYMGLPDLQFHISNSQGCHRPFLTDQGIQLPVSGSSS